MYASVLNTAASLMKGFLCERRGDPAGAQGHWRRGLKGSMWLTLLTREERRGLNRNDVRDTLYGLILGSLTGTLTDADAEDGLEQLTATASSDSPLQKMLRALRLPPAALREMWRGPRGRRLAEKIAFRDLPLADLVRLPTVLAGAEMLRLGSLPGPPTPEQDQLIWELARDTFDGYVHGKLSASQYLLIGLAWKGNSGALGWGGVAGKLRPQVRGPLAYVLGHRYRRLGRAAEAPAFFRAALADAPPGSALERLTRAELEQLKK